MSVLCTLTWLLEYWKHLVAVALNKLCFRCSWDHALWYFSLTLLMSERLPPHSCPVFQAVRLKLLDLIKGSWEEVRERHVSDSYLDAKHSYHTSPDTDNLGPLKQFINLPDRHPEKFSRPFLFQQSMKSSHIMNISWVYIESNDSFIIATSISIRAKMLHVSQSTVTNFILNCNRVV